MEEGRSAVGEGLVDRVRLANRNRSSCKRKGVLWCHELPLCPKSVNHLNDEGVNHEYERGHELAYGVVEEEHWIVRSPLGSCVAVRRSSTTGAETSHISSNDEMRTTVRPLRFQVRVSEVAEGGGQKMTYLWAFKICLETSKVAEETVQQDIIVSSRKGSVDQDCWVDRGS